MPTPTETDYEVHIEKELLARGWRKGDPGGYDRDLCLIPSELIGFLEETQGEKLNLMRDRLGGDADGRILHGIASEIGRDGVLEVLRNGYTSKAVTLDLMIAPPASSYNRAHQEEYRRNRFTLVRQLKYIPGEDKSIDLGFFLNGIPVMTAELKNSTTGQDLDHAIRQYRQDRVPNNSGSRLLAFKRCVAHFAVGNERAAMTTELRGGETIFLPYNRGITNPVNDHGYRVAYLWEEVWTPESLLDILLNYAFIDRPTREFFNERTGQVESESYPVLIFPRYHQLDVVRKIVDTLEEAGPGRNFLVMHSTGSGKSYSIAWLAHRLTALFRAGGTERMFDSIIVISDRRVLDRQLQETMARVNGQHGVVENIDRNSRQLEEALVDGKNIIVSTIQKYPVIANRIADLPNRRFAIIVDEAHSGQSGEQRKAVAQAVGSGGTNEEGENGSWEEPDEVIRSAKARTKQKNISWFAFTATPRNMTLELFGEPTRDGGFRPFHVYSMRQAIEEKYIVDVLRNYTTHRRYFELRKQIDDDPEVNARKASRALFGAVDQDPRSVEGKVRVFLNHFVQHGVKTLGGEGRGMIVTSSRLNCVRYFHEVCRRLAEKGIEWRPLVAFSGKVVDPTTGISHTEGSLNGLPRGTSIPQALKNPRYRLLIVANKFQTGFDEPLLTCMYVDKRLEGIEAVQTLSRLNRTKGEKYDEGVLVLDMVNEAEDVQEAFRHYYDDLVLPEPTDYDRLVPLAREIRESRLIDEEELEEYVAILYAPLREALVRLQPLLDRAVDRFEELPSGEVKKGEEPPAGTGGATQASLRAAIASFNRTYPYVTQLVDWIDPENEKLYQFTRLLEKKLPPRPDDPLPHDFDTAVEVKKIWVGQKGTPQQNISVHGEGAEEAEARGVSTMAGVGPQSKEHLTTILDRINEAHTFGGETDDTREAAVRIIEQVMADPDVRSRMAAANSASNIRTMLAGSIRSYTTRLSMSNHPEDMDLYVRLIREEMQGGMVDLAWAQMRGG